jgi:hypothetical protein
MYTVGQLVEGERYNDKGQTEIVTGPFAFRTDEPGEMIQDIVVKIDGKCVYLDEQGVRVAPEGAVIGRTIWEG